MKLAAAVRRGVPVGLVTAIMSFQGMTLYDRTCYVHAMTEDKGRLHAPAPPPDEDAIRLAAEETLRQWPDAEAAILYGSRARGDHRPDSDWDIAIVTREATSVPEDVALWRLDSCAVGLLPVTRERLRSKCNAPGHVGFDIARQGRLLAGRWQWPSLKENASMQPEEFIIWYDGARSNLNHAASQLADVASKRRTVDAHKFVAATSDAAEFLVKGMICRQAGLTPRKTHDLEDIVEELPKRWQGRFAGIARELNGRTREHHVAAYGGAEEEDCRHAAVRAVRTLDLLVEELAIARHEPGLALDAEDVIRTLLIDARNWSGALRGPVAAEAGRASGIRDERNMVAAALEQREILAGAFEVAAARIERMQTTGLD